MERKIIFQGIIDLSHDTQDMNDEYYLHHGHVFMEDGDDGDLHFDWGLFDDVDDDVILATDDACLDMGDSYFDMDWHDGHFDHIPGDVQETA